MSYTDVLRLARRLTSARNCTAVLVASDEPGFVAAAHQFWGITSRIRIVRAPAVSAAACRNRSKGCSGLHLDEHSDNFRKTREAVVTMVLLSKCTYLLKTPSLFSAFAALLRPEIHAMLTHRGVRYANEFPERILPLAEDFLKTIGG